MNLFSSLQTLAILIPGTGYDVSTRTIFGWVLGAAMVYLTYRAIAAAVQGTDERDKEKRAEQVKWSVIIWAVGAGIFGALLLTGIISLADVQQAMDAV